MRIPLLIAIGLAFAGNTVAEESKEREALVATIAETLVSGKEVSSIGSLRVGKVGTLERASGFAVIQVLDDKIMLVRAWESGPLALFRGVSTEGITDDSHDAKLLRNLLLVVSGTETYTTAIGGTNTVFVVEAVQGDLLEKVAAFIDASERKQCTREWVDISGRFRIDAEFLEYHKLSITLKRKDNGKRIDVSMQQLDKKSQDWVRNWLKGRPKREALQEKLKSLGFTSNGKVTTKTAK